ncbi:MAG TPA: universal stress protein [Thermodesulfobacteriaceae bacterium]|nr:universal stress protein [Thermodesulfobacteriaceae bacterium]
MVEIKKILFPVDFTTSSTKVLPYVKYMAEKLAATIHIIHVVRGPEEFSGFEMGAAWYASFEGEILKGAEQAMTNFLEDNMTGIDAVESSIKLGDAVEQILKEADNIGADLIIIGTHGRKGLEKIMFGSVAEGVVKRAECPVMTVNPHKTGK